MATPARRGGWSRTCRGLTMITHQHFIRSFAGRFRATSPSATQDGRVDAGLQRAPRQRPEFNP